MSRPAEYYLRQQPERSRRSWEIGGRRRLDELQERLKKAGLPRRGKGGSEGAESPKTIPAASSEYTVARTYLD
jgi:ATP-dependent Lon protease